MAQDRHDAPPGHGRVAAVKGAVASLDASADSNGRDAAAVAERLQGVRDRITSCGGDPGTIGIVAVTKGFGHEAVRAASLAGLSDVGENYAQELLAKRQSSPPGIRWHFLGSVQRNKVKRLAPCVDAWHGIDTPAIARSVAAAAPGARVFAEVNTTGSPRRPGCDPGDLDELVEACRQLPLDLVGLMTVAPQGDLSAARECFRWLAAAGRRLGLRELSMGMSDDFEVAVQEGATTLRLGRVLFGPRPSRDAVQR